MVLTIQRWGNSLAVRLPKGLAQQMAITQGSHVDCEIKNNTLIVKKEKQKTYQLNDLLKSYKSSMRHEEVVWGEAQGKEIW